MHVSGWNTIETNTRPRQSGGREALGMGWRERGGREVIAATSHLPRDLLTASRACRGRRATKEVEVGDSPCSLKRGRVRLAVPVSNGYPVSASLCSPFVVQSSTSLFTPPSATLQPWKHMSLSSTRHPYNLKFLCTFGNFQNLENVSN